MKFTVLALLLALTVSTSHARAAEGLSEQCDLAYSAQCQRAEAVMEANARAACHPKWARRKSPTTFDRYLIPCPDKEHVFGVAATATFECWSPF